MLIRSCLAAMAAAFAVGCSSAPRPAAFPSATLQRPAPVRTATVAVRLLAPQNAARAQLGQAPVAWDPVLAGGAGAYADELARSGVWRHSVRAERPGIGENLWMGSRGAFAPEQMVGAWLSEARLFRPGVFPAVSRTGNWSDVAHYTQIVWRTTTRVGCAIRSNAGFDYLVCRYAPAGNVDGKPVP